MNYKTYIVRGISYGKDGLGAYALIFEDEKSYVILPVVIGNGEVQGVSFDVDNGAKSNKPLLMHDVFSKFIKEMGYHVDSVEIYQIVNGVFLSNIIFKNNDENIITLDARTSDAIAMALRFSAPIHATESVILEAGIVLSMNDIKQNDVQINLVEEDYSVYSTEYLQELLDIFVKKENFDVAMELYKELRKRKKKDNLYF